MFDFEYCIDFVGCVDLGSKLVFCFLGCVDLGSRLVFCFDILG